MRPVVPSVPPLLLAVLLAILLAACGGGSDGPPTDNQSLTVAKADPSGDAQSAAAGAQTADPLRVIVRRGGTPAAGIGVTWSATGGGSLNPTTSTTDAAGIATSRWTLGTAGVQTAQASVAGATGSPVGFTATITGGAAQNVVEVQNNLFSPSTITVPANTLVRWNWVAGSRQHNIVPVAPASIPSSPQVRDGPATYEVTFTAPGTYNYYCSVHGTPTSGMRGTVVVQ